MTTPESKLILCPVGEGNTKGILLLPEKMGKVETYENFADGEGAPAGWAPHNNATDTEPERTRWWGEGGCLWGSAPYPQHAVLWSKTTVPGNHAIRFTASIMPSVLEPIESAHDLGELIAYWNTGGDTWGTTVCGLDGWYAGFSGIEYLTTNKDGALVTDGRSVAMPMQLEACRNYEILAGRHNGTDFTFVDGQLLMQVTDTQRKRLDASGVGLGTYGDKDRDALMRIEKIEILSITEESTREVDLALRAPQNIVQRSPSSGS
jgi:hypothetical protein